MPLIYELLYDARCYVINVIGYLELLKEGNSETYYIRKPLPGQ